MAEVVAIAQDVQGAEVAIPSMEKAKATYRCLLDQHNAVANACNLKYVPVAIIVDESGLLVRAVGGVNIGDGEFRPPQGLTIDIDGYVYVSDQGNHRILVFKPTV